MDGMGAADVGDAGLGQAEKSYFALFDQFADRAGHVSDRHGRIDAVLIEQVDIVGAKPAQRALYCLTDMVGPTVSFSADLLATLETKAKLGGDHHLVAPALERPAEQLLVGERTIALGRIKEGASQFDGAMKSGDRFSLIRWTIRLALDHTAKADRRYL